MKPLVIDASAALDSLGRPELAGHIVGTYEATAPALFQWEVGQVVHAKRPDLFGDPTKRRAIVRALVSPMRLVEQSARLEAIADLVDKTKLSFYDASYLQLAIDENAALVTHDKTLHSVAARRLGHRRVWTLDEAENARPRGKF